MKFTKAFEVKGNLDRAFELTEKYVQGMNFKIRNEVRPSRIILERGSGWGSVTSSKIENSKTVLTISFGQAKDEVNILCDYDITIYGIVISSDKTTLESEVEKLKNFLITSLTQ
jgi:hypothetical protein